MTPDSIAGLKIPEEQLQDLLNALAEMHEDNVIPLTSVLERPKAA